LRANELLLWMSARREGSWLQFRAAVEELHSVEDNSDGNGGAQTEDSDFPVHQQLRLNFECAAHAEFFELDSRYMWRIAPPVLAAHPTPQGFRAVLCGARSPALRERMFDARRGCEIETKACNGVPDVIRLAASSLNAISEAAAQARVYFQPYAPRSILSFIRPYGPPVAPILQAEFPIGDGWRIREFDFDSLRWRTADRQRAQSVQRGALEFSLYDDWRYFLRSAGKTFKLPRAVALYALLNRRAGLLRYDKQAQTLKMPGTCRPPRLLERALVLCSGLPPTFDLATSSLTYTGVPPDIAGFAAELLRQPLT
jgi:hypothetical protein